MYRDDKHQSITSLTSGLPCWLLSGHDSKNCLRAASNSASIMWRTKREISTSWACRWRRQVSCREAERKSDGFWSAEDPNWVGVNCSSKSWVDETRSKAAQKSLPRSNSWIVGWADCRVAITLSWKRAWRGEIATKRKFRRIIFSGQKWRIKLRACYTPSSGFVI